MKVAIVCHDLSGGGAERVVAIVATGLAQRKHNISIFLERQRLENIGYLDRSISLSVLEGNSRVARMRSLVRHLRGRQYDIVHTINPLMSLQTLMVKRFAALKQGAIVGSYHGLFAQTSGILGRLSYLLTPIITRVADKNVCVSKVLEADLIAHWGARPANLVVIYNPVAIFK